MTRSHVTAAVFQTRARFCDTFTSDLSEDRQCCESWRDAELGVCAVCAVDDTTGKDLVLVRWVDLLCYSPHCDTAWAVWQTIRLPHSVQVLLATTTDARRHRPFAARPTTPAVRSVGVVYYEVATTRLLLSACCLSLVRLLLLGDILGFILRYRLFFPVYLLVSPCIEPYLPYSAVVLPFMFDRCRCAPVLLSLSNILYRLLKLYSCFIAVCW